MKKIKMQLFGSFCLSDGMVVVGEKELHRKKLIRLLVYLLINRDSILTHQQLIDALWGGYTRNPDVSLRNSIYQLRGILKLLGEEKYIKTLPGGYCWNSEIIVETDYELFEQKLHTLRTEELDIDKQQKLCEEILHDFSGNIAEVAADEEWMLGRKQYYEAAYLDTLKFLCSILEQKEQWERLGEVSRKMQQAGYEDEDIRSWQIMGLYEQKKQEMNQMPKEISVDGGHLKTIKSLLDEEEGQEGAYVCDFSVFKQLYQLETRRIERMGIAEYAVLFTLSKKGRMKRETASDLILADGMYILEQAIRKSLRSSDVAARNGATQFIILLPTCTYESSIKVAERILQVFLKNCGKRHLMVSYEVAEITAGKLS